MTETLREIEESIRAIPYPKLDFPADPEDVNAHRDARIEYRMAVDAKTAEFKAECFEVYGLTNHPKAEEMWEMAWEEGHPAGLYEVEAWIQRLAELFGEQAEGEPRILAITFINGNPAECGCRIQRSDGHGGYSDVITVRPCGRHNG